ncbi:MAG: hypothetical protein OJF50_000993 [Nitrospira sp.]|nr:hypothetical protein [Nitrospira sp.]
MIVTGPQQLFGSHRGQSTNDPHDVTFRTLGVLRGVLEG